MCVCTVYRPGFDMVEEEAGTVDDIDGNGGGEWMMRDLESGRRERFFQSSRHEGASQVSLSPSVA